MKRLHIGFFPVLVFLLLTGCSSPQSSMEAFSAPTDSVASSMLTSEITSWTEVSLLDDSYGYVTAQAETTGLEALPDGYQQSGDCYYTLDGLNLTQYDRSGNVLCTLASDALSPEDSEYQTEEALTDVCFGSEAIWLIHNVYTITNEATGNTDVDSALEQWSYTGELLQRIPLDDSFGVEDGDNIAFLALSPDEEPLLGTINALYFLDKDGTVRSSSDTEGTQYSTVRNRDGNLYLQSSDAIYSIDWDNQALGTVFLDLSISDSVYSGSGPYDFFLSSDSQLRGVSAANRSITTLLNWEDCGLSGLVNGVSYIDEDHLLVNSYDTITKGTRYLDVTRMPKDEIPEKATLTLAVYVSEEALAMGMDWTSCVDTTFADAVTNFNLSHSDVEVVGVAYSSTQELQLMLSSDPPDLIYWTSTGSSDNPTFQTYARQGYLADLESLIETDSTLSMSDFYSNVIDAAKNIGGGLYAVPLNFSLQTLSASSEYVGTEMGWSISELIDAAAQLPEDMVLLEGYDRSSALNLFLDVSIERFASLALGTCNFETQEFYNLLTVCRDYFPSDGISSGDALLSLENVMGGMGNFALDTLQTAEDQGKTLIGFPDAGGNGFDIVLGSELSICALSDHQDAAWEFYRTLLGFDYQRASNGIQLSIRIDAQEDKEDWLVAQLEDLTQEASESARALIADAESATVYDNPIVTIVLEEVEAFFAGDRSAEDTAALIQSRVEIYLGEQG